MWFGDCFPGSRVVRIMREGGGGEVEGSAGGLEGGLEGGREAGSDVIEMKAYWYQ